MVKTRLRRDLRDSIANQLSPLEADLGRDFLLKPNDIYRNVSHNLEKQLELMRKVC